MLKFGVRGERNTRVTFDERGPCFGPCFSLVSRRSVVRFVPRLRFLRQPRDAGEGASAKARLEHQGCQDAARRKAEASAPRGLGPPRQSATSNLLEVMLIRMGDDELVVESPIGLRNMLV